MTVQITAAAATTKSLQSCPTLCDPIDGLLPSSSVPGIIQARTMEWVAISFSTKLLLCFYWSALQIYQSQGLKFSLITFERLPGDIILSLIIWSPKLLILSLTDSNIGIET